MKLNEILIESTDIHQVSKEQLEQMFQKYKFVEIYYDSIPYVPGSGKRLSPLITMLSDIPANISKTKSDELLSLTFDGKRYSPLYWAKIWWDAVKDLDSLYWLASGGDVVNESNFYKIYIMTFREWVDILMDKSIDLAPSDEESDDFEDE